MDPDSRNTTTEVGILPEGDFIQSQGNPDSYLGGNLVQPIHLMRCVVTRCATVLLCHNFTKAIFGCTVNSQPNVSVTCGGLFLLKPVV